MLPLLLRALASLLLTPIFLLVMLPPWLIAPGAEQALPAQSAVWTDPQPLAATAAQPATLAQESPPAALSSLPATLPTRVITVLLAAPQPAFLAVTPTISALATSVYPQPTPITLTVQPPSLSTVNTDRLNLRAGPGTAYPIVGLVDFGASLQLRGRSADCTWLQVGTATDATGWGLAEYITQATECAQLPVVAADPLPTPPPLAEIVAAQASAPTVAEAPPAPAAACGVIPTEHYDLLPIEGAPTDRPAVQHPDINLAVRGYASTAAELAVIHFDAADDPLAPQLAGLFADRRIPALTAAYQVYDWDWGCDCRGSLLAQRGASMVGLTFQPGETIYTPDSGRGLGSGYEVLVLYASENQLTLKYTREDNVISGYTLHLGDLCVEPRLLALYHTADQAGRGQLPALRAGQAVGQAAGAELKLAIRDTGDFMDPRDREDWWRVR